MPLCYYLKKNNTIIKLNCTTHNHDLKSTENVQNVLTVLTRRVLTDVNQTIGKIYEEEIKKKVRENFIFSLYSG